MWDELAVALCLMMVIEGIWPFLDPTGMRRAMSVLAEQDDHTLRIIGFLSMISGVILLYLVH